MKTLAALTLLAASLAMAGPLKVATYPLVHPKKTAHATKVVATSLFKLGKAVVW